MPAFAPVERPEEYAGDGVEEDALGVVVGKVAEPLELVFETVDSVFIDDDPPSLVGAEDPKA